MRRVRLGVLVGLVAVLVLSSSACVTPVRWRPRVVTLLNNLGEATTRSRLTVEGRNGISVAYDESVGLQFEVTRPTFITEVGGFIETYVAGDPRADDVLVEIHPARADDGRPDRDTVIASAQVTPRADGNVITYQPAFVRVLLRPGTYYALFAADQSAAPGAIDVIAISGGQRIVYGGVVPYTAPVAIGGVTHPNTGLFDTQQPFSLAQVVRGVLLPANIWDCGAERWKRFADQNGEALPDAATCRAVLQATSG
jgi:hypothetical protein